MRFLLVSVLATHALAHIVPYPFIEDLNANLYLPKVNIAPANNFPHVYCHKYKEYKINSTDMTHQRLIQGLYDRQTEHSRNPTTEQERYQSTLPESQKIKFVDSVVIYVDETNNGTTRVLRHMGYKDNGPYTFNTTVNVLVNTTVNGLVNTTVNDLVIESAGRIMYKWFGKGPDRVPAYMTAREGISVLLFSREKDQIALVKERVKVRGRESDYPGMRHVTRWQGTHGTLVNHDSPISSSLVKINDNFGLPSTGTNRHDFIEWHECASYYHTMKFGEISDNHKYICARYTGDLSNIKKTDFDHSIEEVALFNTTQLHERFEKEYKFHREHSLKEVIRLDGLDYDPLMIFALRNYKQGKSFSVEESNPLRKSFYETLDYNRQIDNPQYSSLTPRTPVRNFYSVAV